MKSSISRFPLTTRQTMHRQDGRQEIDRRILLAKGAAFAALLVTGCARKESRRFAATSLRQLRASDESDHDFVRSSGSGPPVLLLQSSARAGRAEVLLQPLRASEAFPSCANHRPLSRLPRGVRGSRWHAKMTMRKETRDRLHAIGCPLAPACPQEQPAGPPAACDSPGRRPRAGARSAAV